MGRRVRVDVLGDGQVQLRRLQQTQVPHQLQQEKAADHEPDFKGKQWEGNLKRSEGAD